VDLPDPFFLDLPDNLLNLEGGIFRFLLFPEGFSIFQRIIKL
jgi:hypothetical protein